MKRTIVGPCWLPAHALAVAAPAEHHDKRPDARHSRTRRAAATPGHSTAARSRRRRPLTVNRGTHVEVGNNDVMPHKLVKVSGPVAQTFVARRDDATASAR